MNKALGSFLTTFAFSGALAFAQSPTTDVVAVPVATCETPQMPALCVAIDGTARETYEQQIRVYDIADTMTTDAQTRVRISSVIADEAAKKHWCETSGAKEALYRKAAAFTKEDIDAARELSFRIARDVCISADGWSRRDFSELAAQLAPDAATRGQIAQRAFPQNLRFDDALRLTEDAPDAYRNILVDNVRFSRRLPFYGVAQALDRSISHARDQETLDFLASSIVSGCKEYGHVVDCVPAYARVLEIASPETANRLAMDLVKDEEKIWDWDGAQHRCSAKFARQTRKMPSSFAWSYPSCGYLLSIQYEMFDKIDPFVTASETRAELKNAILARAANAKEGFPAATTVFTRLANQF